MEHRFSETQGLVHCSLFPIPCIYHHCAHSRLCSTQRYRGSKDTAMLTGTRETGFIWVVNHLPKLVKSLDLFVFWFTLLSGSVWILIFDLRQSSQTQGIPTLHHCSLRVLWWGSRKSLNFPGRRVSRGLEGMNAHCLPFVVWETGRADWSGGQFLEWLKWGNVTGWIRVCKYFLLPQLWLPTICFTKVSFFLLIMCSVHRTLWRWRYVLTFFCENILEVAYVGVL